MMGVPNTYNSAVIGPLANAFSRVFLTKEKKGIHHQELVVTELCVPNWTRTPVDQVLLHMIYSMVNTTNIAK